MLKTIKIFTGSIALVMVATFLYIFDPTDFEGTVNQLKFTGVFGTEVQMENLKSIELIDQVPPINHRTNGVAVGPLKKGLFIMEGFGSTRLLIHSSQGPFLKITPIDGDALILNYSKKERTELIYTAIQALRKS
ncbi:MAG: hypothetical protein ACXIUD_01365 [Mongoliitalea sp.]